MMIDFTTVTAVDDQHLAELRAVWPTWKTFRPEILRHPMLVICDGDLSERHWQDRLSFLDHPDCRRSLWAMKGVSQREKMLTALVRVPATEVATPWYLKLDTDAVALRADDWLQSQWFAANRHGQAPVFVSSGWGYTKPADAIQRLDAWGDALPAFQELPPLNIVPRPGAAFVRHSRIISWCFFAQTRWTQEMASLCPRRLPVASQDTFLWYCAARRGDFYRRVKMANFGWAHLSSLGKLQQAARRALARVDALPAATKPVRAPAGVTTLRNRMNSSVGTSARPTAATRRIVRRGIKRQQAQDGDMPNPPACAAELTRLLERLGRKPLRGVEVGRRPGMVSSWLLRQGKVLQVTLIDRQAGPSVDRRQPPPRPLLRPPSGRPREDVAVATETGAFAGKRRPRRALPPLEDFERIKDGSLDFVFLDTKRAHGNVAVDLQFWWPKIRPGGVLCGQNYGRCRRRPLQWAIGKAVGNFARKNKLQLRTGRHNFWSIERT